MRCGHLFLSLTIFIAVSVVPVAARRARAGDPFVLDAQVGPVFLMRSRSHAVGHAFKAGARVGLRRSLGPRLELGAAVSGLLDSNSHYRVAGVLMHGRLALWRRPVFSLGAGMGLGIGTNADILHDDLRAGASPVVPYGFLALDARWVIAGQWLIGAEAGWENLSIVRLGALVGFVFDQGSRGHP